MRHCTQEEERRQDAIEPRRLQASVENAQGPKTEQRSLLQRGQAHEANERQKPRKQEARKKHWQALRRARILEV